MHPVKKKALFHLIDSDIFYKEAKGDNDEFEKIKWLGY